MAARYGLQKSGHISNPNSVDINKTLMRCVTKAISMFRLGFYIYADKDFPEPEKIVIQQKKRIKKLNTTN
ncbi:MAG: DUF1071 domain-containing protein [Candidatus Phlomobacter fragariae]